MVPLVGRPDTVREWPVAMAPLLWRLLPPALVPTRSQWAVSWLVWAPVKVTEVLVKVEPGEGELSGSGKGKFHQPTYGRWQTKVSIGNA